MVARDDITFEAMLPTEADVVAFKESFDRNGQPKDLPTLRWHFIDNAPKSTRVLFAKAPPSQSAARVIGAIYAVLPNRFCVSGDIVTGVQSLDTLTDVNFRRMGLFTDLAEEMYRRCVNEGYKLVYGMPNGNSVHGFFSKLGWVNLDPLPLLVRPLLLSFILRQLPYLGEFVDYLPDIRLRWSLFRRKSPLKDAQLVPIVHFDERATELWRSFRKSDCKVAIERDGDYLNWRVFEKPNAGYSAVGVVNANRELLGYVILKGPPEGRRGAGAIVELIYRPELHEVGRALLDHAVEKLEKSSCDAILALNFRHSLNHKVFADGGFFYVPSRLIPGQLHFGARSFDCKYDATISDRRNWYLSLCDSDTD